MSIGGLYIIGVLITYGISILRMAYYEDNPDCKFTDINCILVVVPIVSLLSWLGVLLNIAEIIYKYRQGR